MNVNMQEAIETLRDKAKNSTKSEDALRFSQAANNLANTRATLVHAANQENLLNPPNGS